MAHYLMKFKGRYRILPELDKETNDFPRNAAGEIEDSYDDIYIACQNGCRIYSYGKEGTRVSLMAYIPSVKRGRGIARALNEKNVVYTSYMETDEEVTFRFKPVDLDAVASLLKAKTFGADISPFSPRNLPKSNIEVPKDLLDQYKSVISSIDRSDLMIIKRITDDFFVKVVQKHFRKQDRKFSVNADMRRMKMSRQRKEYIYHKGMWDEYISFLSRRIKQHIKMKNNNVQN